MSPRLFIHRPKLAIVIAVVITLVGFMALSVIPVAQYPNLLPPQVSVSTQYPGGSAQTIVNTIAEPIEEQVNGVPDMLYMQSTSSSSGTYNLTVTFALGSDPNIDQVNVQNRIQLAEPLLPPEVQDEGLSVRSSASSFVMAINLYSPNKKYDQVFISNYAYMHLQQQIARIPGVGNTNIFGEREYAMRVWLNPTRMTALGLTADDVIEAIRSQNLQVAAGQIGEPPVSGPQQQQLTVLTPGELTSVPEFDNIVVRASPNAGVVRIKDIAKVQLGAETYNASAALNGAPSATLAVYEAPDANALEISAAVHAQMRELSKDFPPGLKFAIVYDTTAFVRANIEDIIITLGITLVLVVGVVYLFLQDWRATLIPTVAIPVSLIGTFAVLYVLGYSANTVNLFAIVLAITLVVDDAIVVVENVTRHLEEDPNQSVAAATEEAITEITGPVIATTMVLVAVFVPVAFISGVIGALYRQFAVTISVALSISAVNALTLSPALCATFLRPPRRRRFLFFRWFNQGFAAARSSYGYAVRFISRRVPIAVVTIATVFVGAAIMLKATPTGFLPDEDQGYFFVSVMMPNGASLERTDATLRQVGSILLKMPGVADVIQLGGFNIVTQAPASNAGSLIAIMKPWHARDAGESVAAVIGRLQPIFNAIPVAQIVSFNPPPIPGLGSAGGINFVLEARRGQSVQRLAPLSRALIFAANQNPNLARVFTGFSADEPQVLVKVDTAKAELMGVATGAIYQALEANLGGEFVDDFNYQNFVFQVMVQDQPQFRAKIADIDQLYVRNSSGGMVPLKELVSVRTIVGPDAITFYDLYPAVLINGMAGRNKSSGQAMTAMAGVAARHLPAGYGYDWTNISYQEQLASGQEAIAFLSAVAFSFLFLVALYESWTLPFSVMLPVAFASLGGLVALRVRSLGLDVYGQIGLVLLIGLAAKNAILIVAFAKERLQLSGAAPDVAAEEAAQIRYRPVMMTALAFIVGVVPLLAAIGAGAGARQSIGTVVFGGMILASFIGILFVPALFVAFERLAETMSRRPRSPQKRRDNRQRSGPHAGTAVGPRSRSH
jgi:hydrophobe/amphiphile efflux-1 (HAE1) family protein